MELAALPGHAGEDGPPGGFQTGMVVADKAADPAQTANLQGVEELAPIHLGLAQGDAHAEDGAFARGEDPGGDEHGAIEHAAVLADLLITGVQIDVGHDCQGGVAPGFQMDVEFGGAVADIAVADMSGTDGMATEVLDDLGHATSVDALDIHLGQGELDGLLTAQSFIEGRGVELQVAANLRHGQFERSHTGLDGFRFKAIGVALSGVCSFVRQGTQGFGALAEHGLVEQGGEAAEQGVEAGVVELLQDGVQESRVVLVGHSGCVC